MTEPLEVHRSLIEFITSELPAHEIGWRRYLGIRPIVVDANVLALDVFFVAHRGRDSALLDLSGFGTGRLFTSSHIYSKVSARLPKLAASGGRCKFLQAAINIWEQQYMARTFTSVTSATELANSNRLLWTAGVGVGITAEWPSPSGGFSAPTVPGPGRRHAGFRPSESLNDRGMLGSTRPLGHIRMV